MSIHSATDAKIQRIAPGSESQPMPLPAATLTRLTERLASLRITEVAPLESILQGRVTIGQAPPNTPTGSPRESSEAIFLEVFEPDSMKLTDPVSSVKHSERRERKSDDFERLFTSRSFAETSVMISQPQSRVGEEEALKADELIFEQLSTPRSAPSLFPIANPGTIVHMPSPPPAPEKRRPPKEQSSTGEIARKPGDLSKKRAREVEQAPTSDKRRVRARLMFDHLTIEEKKDIPSLDFKPFEKKIDVSFPFCAADQIPMFYNIIIHPRSQIWSGMDGNYGHKGKIASFLPSHIDENQFKTLLEQAVSSGNGGIVYQGNKGLFQLEMNGACFEVEVTLLEGKIHSVQPIFHFEHYDQTRETIRVDYLSRSFVGDPVEPGVYELPYSELLDLIKAHASAPSFKFPIAYETENTLFVDVAILDGNCPVKGPIIIAIPKAVVEDRMSI